MQLEYCTILKSSTYNFISSLALHLLWALARCINFSVSSGHFGEPASSPSPPLGSQKLECEEQAQFPTGSIYSVSDVPLLVAIGLRENE